MFCCCSVIDVWHTCVEQNRELTNRIRLPLWYLVVVVVRYQVFVRCKWLYKLLYLYSLRHAVHMFVSYCRHGVCVTQCFFVRTVSGDVLSTCVLIYGTKLWESTLDKKSRPVADLIVQAAITQTLTYDILNWNFPYQLHNSTSATVGECWHQFLVFCAFQFLSWMVWQTDSRTDQTCNMA